MECSKFYYLIGAEVSKSVSGGKSALSTQAGLQSKEKESGGLYLKIGLYFLIEIGLY